MIVVDATVVAGFPFPGDQFHAHAYAVRDKDADWHCPELVFSEVRSVGMKHHQKGDTLDATIARCNLTPATVSVYRMHSHSVLCAAIEGSVWIYDAEYVALARQLQVKLVTTDEKILEQFPAVALSPHDFLKA
jgi:predicted nucleic acid-binding protein